MQLNSSQKNYIKKNIKHFSASKIASNLNLKESVVADYLKASMSSYKLKEIAEKNKEKNFLGFGLFDWVKQNKIYFLLLAFLVFLVYFNSFGASFVSDDRGIILNVDSVDYLFANPLSFFRQLIYFLTFKIFGLNPLFFRFSNVLFHLGTVWLVYMIISYLFKPRTGLFAAAIFAVHPILLESVTWISAGVYLQYSFFFLLSFLCYLLSFNSKNSKWFIFSSIFFGLSLLSSEKALPLFLIFIVFEFLFGNFRNNWKKNLSYFLISIIFIIFYFSKAGQRVESLATDSGPSDLIGLENPLLQVPIAVTSYLFLMLWPSSLTIYHSEMSFSQQEYILRLIIFLIFAGVIFYSYFKNRKIFFFLSFFFISLLPFLTPIRIAWIVAERYVYLGSVGIFTVFSFFFSKLIEIKKTKMIAITFFILIIIAFSARSIIRNVDWQNEDNLWIATGKTSPSSPNNHNNLGDVYGRNGDLARAEYEFKKAIELKPNYADAYHNLGNTYAQMGKAEEALVNFKKAAELNPKLWQSYQNIAIIYYSQDKLKEAEENLDKALLIYPENSVLLTAKGTVYLKMGDKSNAKEMFSRALMYDQKNENAKQGLIEALK